MCEDEQYEEERFYADVEVRYYAEAEEVARYRAEEEERHHAEVEATEKYYRKQLDNEDIIPTTFSQLFRKTIHYAIFDGETTLGLRTDNFSDFIIFSVKPCKLEYIGNLNDLVGQIILIEQLTEFLPSFGKRPAYKLKLGTKNGSVIVYSYNEEHLYRTPQIALIEDPINHEY